MFSQFTYFLAARFASRLTPRQEFVLASVPWMLLALFYAGIVGDWFGFLIVASVVSPFLLGTWAVLVLTQRAWHAAVLGGFPAALFGAWLFELWLGFIGFS